MVILFTSTIQIYARVSQMKTLNIYVYINWLVCYARVVDHLAV